MKKPRVTVGMSFHNEERFLDVAIRSVLAQTLEDFELVLIDDGSTDGSVSIAKRYLSDRRVRLWTDGQRKHLAARLNQIVGEAKGDLLARMDADDAIHPTRLARQIELLSQSNADAVGCWYAVVDADEKPLGAIEAKQNVADVLRTPALAHATMLCRTDWIRQYPYDESLTRAEDRDLWCRAVGSSKLAVVEDILYVVRVVFDQPSFLPDYRAGQADLRRVIRRYGPAQIGRIATTKSLASSWMKSAAVELLGPRISRAARKRQGRALKADELLKVQEALRPPPWDTRFDRAHADE